MRRWCIVIVFLLLFLPITVNAHSGGTDSNGGHHDGDDYHYHHGYPAHDHYDMDDDGDLDCPYEFDDKTEQGSDNISGGSGTILKPKPTETETVPPPVESTKPLIDQEDKPFDPGQFMEDISQYLAVAIGLLLLLSLIISFFSKKAASLCAFLSCVLFMLDMILWGILSILDWFL